MDRNKLTETLSDIKKKAKTLTSTSGFLSLNFHYNDAPELHMSARGFLDTFPPEDVLIEKFSWSEQEGFRYKVSIDIAGVQIFCLMKEDQRERYLSQAQPDNGIAAAEITA